MNQVIYLTLAGKPAFDQSIEEGKMVKTAKLSIMTKTTDSHFEI
jgi:hypothetical protein